MRNSLVHILVVLVGVLIGIGGVFGVLALLQPEEQTSAARSTNVPEQMESPTKSSLINDSPGSSNTDEAPSQIENLIFPKQAFNRKLSMVSWVANLPDKKILSWLEQTTESSGTVSIKDRNDLQAVLLQKLSTSAPDKAIAFAWSREDQQRYSLASIVFRSWARTDLESAIAHVKQLDEQESSFYMPTILRARNDLTLERQREIAKELGDETFAFTNYFQTMARSEFDNPKETWFEIIDLANEESVQDAATYALRRVALTWFEKEGLQALDQIVSSISLDAEYSAALSQIFSVLGNDEPEEIFDYLISNLGDQAQEIIQHSSILFNWARKDPKGMLSKAETLPASGLRRDLVSRAVQQWAANNPRQVLEQLEVVPRENREQATSTAISTLARTAPEEAAKFVTKESNSQTQETLAYTLIREWSYQDVDAAKEWVFSLPQNDPLRSSLIPALTRALVNTDPRAAFQLALEQPIPEQESDLFPAMSPESSIMYSIAYQDLDLAIELLPQVRDVGQGKTYAYSTVGSTLIQKGETQRALDLASQLPAEKRTRYYQTVSSGWAMRDPQGLIEAFDSFPSQEVKSTIATSLTVFNRTMNTYSADEIARLKKYISKEDQEKLEMIEDIDLSNPSAEEREILEELFSW